jgi:hypothetical protein
MEEFDSSRFILFSPRARETVGGVDRSEVRIATVTGTDITYGDATILGASESFACAAVLSSKNYVFAYPTGTNIGTAYATGSLTASNGNAFATAVNKTRVSTAFWAKNPTKNGGSVAVKRGYTVTLGENAITLGTATATWNTTLAVNDGLNHLIALDFEHQGGTNWKLRTSVDGGAWVDRGTQASGSQALAAANTTPNIAMTNPAGDGWVDETVMWVNADLFTTGELQNLYDLSQVFGDSMDQYESNFGAPLCWQATARMSDGSIWRDSGAGPCPQVLRVPAGASDIVVTDDGHRVNPVISEG